MTSRRMVTYESGVRRGIKHVLYAWVIDRPSEYEVEYLSWDIDAIFHRITYGVEVGYTMESTFCSRYIRGIETRFTRDERNDDTIVENKVIDDFEIFKQKVQSLGASSVRAILEEEKQLFHRYILNNADEISEKHLRLQRRHAQNSMDLYKIHEWVFPEWFQAQVLELRQPANLSDDFFSLAMGPSFDVRCYNGCIVGGMDYGEFTKDMSTFAPTPIQNAPVALRFLLRMVEHMGSAIQITTPHDVFGVRRKCCTMIESLKDFTSMRPIATACLDAYIMYLYTRMEPSRTLNLYKFVDAGSISCGSYKEERAQLLTARLLGTDYDQLLLFSYNSGNHWTLVIINLTNGAAFWTDPLKNRIDPDVTEVVERSTHLYVYLQCPKQSGVVKCGYYVMQFMRDIIMSTSTSIIQIVDKCLNKAKGNPMAFYKVLPQSIGAMKPWIRQLVDV
ncbi:uncharacterized protein E6C27_scaffold20G00050 [Cucumis melo var. makuwa]|uniref:Ubiquitin-like protease family profile domain-containing protein n=1 Tax=Cucumis melo var. makuwa TaxID=1194695 RepID=A0A5A7T1E8_CUCMM|nr:uncharacterized protein E6C27_scaffold20G00050 [Cucumis melo var. makuwa]